MPQGFIRIIGDPIQAVAGRLATYRDERAEVPATRPRLRKAAFDTGEAPLVALSAPSPRLTGWERDYQRDHSV